MIFFFLYLCFLRKECFYFEVDDNRFWSVDLFLIFEIFIFLFFLVLVLNNVFKKIGYGDCSLKFKYDWGVKNFGFFVLRKIF